MDTAAAGQTRRLRVFLCHSSGDKPAIRQLCDRLEKDGYEPWLDERQLLPGEQWRSAVQRSVRNSDLVVVCMSSASVKKEGFVQSEIRYALDVALEKPEGTIFIVPARLDDCDVPESLRSRHWVNLFAADGYSRLCASLDARADHLGIARRLGTVRTTTWVRVEPALEWVGLVLPKNPEPGTIFCFNLDCRLVNAGIVPVTLDRLEARLTDTYNCTFRMAWTVFYKTTGNLQQSTGKARPVRLAPDENRDIGIQFGAPRSVVGYRWLPGRYSLDLTGWLAQSQGKADQPDFVTPCEISVDADSARRLEKWTAEYEAADDPDNAIAIPVPIRVVVALQP